jgi:fructokinase
MKPVICFGEALIDFLNIGKTQDLPLTLNEFRQYPGGAPANVAVAIAKLGGQSYFVGQVGQDSFGDFLEDALQQYQVNTQYLSRHATAKTALAFVMLDQTGDRSFEFYRGESADMLFAPEQITPACFSSASIFHFCSNTLTSNFIENTTQHAVSLAKNANVIVSFDVNLRNNLWPNETVNIDCVNRFVEQADVLKFSKEELAYLARGNEEDYIAELLAKDVSLIIMTDGPDNILYYGRDSSGVISPPKVKAVDTTAGGDAFIGSFLFALSHQEQINTTLSNEQKIIKLIKFAASCSAYTVTKPGAFPALPCFIDVKEAWLQSS